MLFVIVQAGAGALILACFRARTEAMDWLVSAGFSYCDTGKVFVFCGIEAMHCLSFLVGLHVSSHCMSRWSFGFSSYAFK